MIPGEWRGTWSIYQDRQFGEYYAQVSGQVLMRLEGLLMYVARKPLLGFTTAYLFSPEASASFSAATYDRLRGFLRSNGIARMVVHTNIPFLCFSHRPTLGGTFVIDLRRAEQELYNLMQGRSRTAVRKAQKLGLQAARVTHEQELRQWYQMYATTAKERQFAYVTYAQVRGLWDSPWGALFAAYQDQTLVAGAFLLLGSYPVYLLGATHPAYRNLSPNNFLQWEVILWAKAQRYLCYDLGGASEDPKHGPTRFKASLGGTFHRSFSYLIEGNRLRYAALKAAEACSRRLPLVTLLGLLKPSAS